MRPIDSRGNTFAQRMKTIDVREQIVEERKEVDKEDDSISLISKNQSRSVVRRVGGNQLFATTQGRNIWSI